MKRRVKEMPPMELRGGHHAQEAELLGVEHGEAIDEVDLHGMDEHDARYAVEQALDAAFYAGETGVRILHGVGTGALRRLVRERILPHNQHVRAWRPADQPFTSSKTIVLVHKRS